ncbi:hypothetical protein BKA56DRAFT_613779 [Ilyonectria sp. MPI-CAGE-AT-0026]|nr:hypothetical protein BKA56DRAFT_613779 [Ilyonectria sp. MPI-CAGE-AT-0026]
MFKRLKGKISRRQAGSKESDTPPIHDTGTTEPRPEKFGLFFVAGNQPDSSSSKLYSVDIIAIHGLNGDAFNTWRHSNGTFWLRDLLPSFLPGCRIYTYGYPSKIFSETSFARMQEYSRGLLSSIRDLHEDSSTALVFAHEDDNFYGEVLKSVIGVAFLGTPHRGSESAKLGSTLATIINICTKTSTAGMRPRAVRNDLLDDLSSNSNTLQDLLLSARNRLRNLTVVSFYETEATPPLSSLVVGRESSILGIPNEDVTPLYENHKTICRFAGETSSYMSVARALRRIACKLPDDGQELKRANTRSSDRSLNDVEMTCMKLFNIFDVAEYKGLLPKPIPGSCQWIRDHPFFVTWLEKTESALLWLTGHPGCGKTMLSFTLEQYFEEIRTTSTPQTVLIYFCDDKVSRQKDAKAIIISLIFQMIQRHRSMIRHVRRIFELQGPSMIESFSSLWSIFLKIAKDPKLGSLYIILDALDECENVTRRQLLESISEMLVDSAHSTRSGNGVKFLVTSRPFLRQSYITDKAPQPHISIDEGQAGYVADLRSFIQRRVDQISLKHDYPSDVRDFLLQTMYSKADHTFLWVHVVLASVETSLLTAMKDFRDIVTRIPPDLKDTYMRYMSDIPSDHLEDASHLLKLLLASSRPLHLDEINTAFTTHSSHSTTEDVVRDSQTAIAHTLQGILGPLPMPACNICSSMISTMISFRPRTHLPIQFFGISDLNDELPLGHFADDSGDENDYTLNADVLFREPDALNSDVCRRFVLKYGFYSYASLHWAEHFAICEESASDALRKSAMSLLSVKNESCRNWFHFYCTESDTSMDTNSLDQEPIVLAARFNLHRTLKDMLNSYESSQAILNQSLLWTSRLGHGRIVAELLTAGSDPNMRGSDRQTALTAAAEHGHLSCVVTILADKRTDINTTGRMGRSGLSFACGNGHDRIVTEFLRQDSCKVDAADDSGATPFFWAVGGGHYSIISALAKQASVDVNHQDKKGRTVVSWAAGDGMCEVLQRLSKLPGIDFNKNDNNGKSPVSWAAGNGHDSVVDFLVQHKKVDKASVDKDLRNAISWASEFGHLNALRILLKNGCPGVDTEDIDGWTPLAWAIQNNAPGVIQALLSTGSVHLERQDRGGRTALSWAVEYGHASVVKVLLQEGADPEAKSNRGTTPISIAREFGRDDILKELLENSPDETGIET